MQNHYFLREIKNLQPLSRRRSSAGEDDPDATARREQLRQKARQLLDNPAAAITSPGAETDEERQRRLREEARRLIDEAVHDGATVPISKTLPSSPDGSEYLGVFVVNTCPCPSITLFVKSLFLKLFMLL